MHLRIDIENWPFKAPFRITGHTFTESHLIVVTLTKDGISGRGEAAGVYYRGDSPQSMARQIEAIRPLIERGTTREGLRSLLPPGGARNALDCALWDLEARTAGIPAWRLAGLEALEPLPTTYTVGADTAQAMARTATSYEDAKRLKLKLTGADDAARLRAVRAARPDAWIGVDANQAYDAASLRNLLPELLAADVRLIEQPVRVGCERELAGFDWPIPLAADESVQSLDDLPRAAGLFDVVNVKLDKCGGLTEALAMVAEIHRLGMTAMVGCMEGTSLAMAPGCIAGARCSLVDLDAPMFLAADRRPPARYQEGAVYCPDGWGMP
ncbi:MAG TPA: dipeptide epimerase [Steroidobacteraceae bacterium]|jgi:L-alanine-DL-glutamate epimerase-like enolase superfamily enzyme